MLCSLLPALAALSCGGAGETPGAATRTGLATLPNSAAVYFAGGALSCVTPGGTLAWELTLPAGAMVAGRPAVAPNSTVYVRSRLALHAVDHKGALLWTASLPEPPPAMVREAFTPAALQNSEVVVLETPTRLRAFGLDGTPGWSADLPSGEANGAPTMGRNSQLLVPTTAGVHAYSSDGALLWSWTRR